MSNVVDDDEVSENMNAVLKDMSDGTVIAQTLGVRPLSDVVDGLRGGSACSAHSYGGKTYSSSKILKKSGSSDMELKATVGSASGAVGVIVAASPDMSEYTTIMYEPSNNTLLVERAHSSMLDEFQNYTVTGYFYPYTIISDGSSMKESITMDVFLDGSLLEVYVNERFAMSTRIYPSMSCSTGYGVYVAPGSKATFEMVEAWEDLLHIWTDRPVDSSSPLVYDTAAETNGSYHLSHDINVRHLLITQIDYVWWPGN